jgi:hypothetical protein
MRLFDANVVAALQLKRLSDLALLSAFAALTIVMPLLRLDAGCAVRAFAEVTAGKQQSAGLCRDGRRCLRETNNCLFQLRINLICNGHHVDE